MIRPACVPWPQCQAQHMWDMDYSDFSNIPLHASHHCPPCHHQQQYIPKWATSKGLTCMHAPTHVTGEMHAMSWVRTSCGPVRLAHVTGLHAQIQSPKSRQPSASMCWEIWQVGMVPIDSSEGAWPSRSCPRRHAEAAARMPTPAVLASAWQ